MNKTIFALFIATVISTTLPLAAHTSEKTHQRNISTAKLTKILNKMNAANALTTAGSNILYIGALNCVSLFALICFNPKFAFPTIMASQFIMAMMLIKAGEQHMADATMQLMDNNKFDFDTKISS